MTLDHRQAEAGFHSTAMVEKHLNGLNMQPIQLHRMCFVMAGVFYLVNEFHMNSTS